MNIYKLIPGVLTLVATLLLGSPASGDDCGNSTRVDPPECVNTSISGKSASATNWCWQKVKLKVNRRTGSDWEWELSHDEEVSDSGSYSIRNIKCCNAAANSHCDQTWQTTKLAACTHRYWQSSANGTCNDETFALTSGDMCLIAASCIWYETITECTSAPDFNNSSCFSYQARKSTDTEITVSHEESDRLNNCEGTLTLGSC